MDTTKPELENIYRNSASFQNSEFVIPYYIYLYTEHINHCIVLQVVRQMSNVIDKN